MKAILYYNYGSPDVLKWEEIRKPTVEDHEILIKVRAASVNPLDWCLMRGKPLFARLMMGGLLKPKATRPGVDLAGQVEAVGRNVTQFKPGDDVFGACRGAFAEYVCAFGDKLASKPANLSFEDAAAVPVAAISALQGLRDKGRIERGHKVLVDGASGGVGTFGVQIAKSFGAEVTAVCSTRNVDTARSIGADHVKDLVFLKDLLEAGKVMPVIDRRYPLTDLAEALRYHEQGHARGKVVITVEHSTDT